MENWDSAVGRFDEFTINFGDDCCSEKTCGVCFGWVKECRGLILYRFANYSFNFDCRVDNWGVLVSNCDIIKIKVVINHYTKNYVNLCWHYFDKTQFICWFRTNGIIFWALFFLNLFMYLISHQNSICDRLISNFHGKNMLHRNSSARKIVPDCLLWFALNRSCKDLVDRLLWSFLELLPVDQQNSQMPLQHSRCIHFSNTDHLQSRTHHQCDI